MQPCVQDSSLNAHTHLSVRAPDFRFPKPQLRKRPSTKGRESLERSSSSKAKSGSPMSSQEDSEEVSQSTKSSKASGSDGQPDLGRKETEQWWAEGFPSWASERGFQAPGMLKTTSRCAVKSKTSQPKTSSHHQPFANAPPSRRFKINSLCLGPEPRQMHRCQMSASHTDPRACQGAPRL